MLVEHPIVGRDMAWLNERRGQPARALRDLDDYLMRRPQDEFAQAQRRRLRASTTAPEDLVDEIEQLEALGEETPPEMIPSYVQGLLETGRGGEARHFVETHLQHWAPPLAAQVAWVCHRRQAFDLALRLFLTALAANKDNYKYLAALESSARRCQRLNEVCQAYRSLAANSPHLYGRLKALQRGSN